MPDASYSPAEILARETGAANSIITNNGDGPFAFGGYVSRPSNPRASDKTGQPTKPATKYATESTYGRIIPLSLGKRRIDGNVIQCSALVPRLVHTGVQNNVTQVPNYEDPATGPNGFQTDTGMCGAPNACNTRSATEQNNLRYFVKHYDGLTLCSSFGATLSLTDLHADPVDEFGNDKTAAVEAMGHYNQTGFTAVVWSTPPPPLALFATFETCGGPF